MASTPQNPCQPRTSHMILFANRVFADRIKLWSYYITVGPHLITSVSIRKQNTKKHIEEAMWWWKRDWNYESKAKKHLRIGCAQQKWGRSKEHSYPRVLSEIMALSKSSFSLQDCDTMYFWSFKPPSMCYLIAIVFRTWSSLWFHLYSVTLFTQVTLGIQSWRQFYGFSS